MQRGAKNPTLFALPIRLPLRHRSRTALPLRLPVRPPSPMRTRSTRQQRPFASATTPPAHPSVHASAWRVARTPDGFLRLNLTLRSGQAFRWRDCGLCEHAIPAAAPSPSRPSLLCREWAGVIGRRLYVLRQPEEPPPSASAAHPPKDPDVYWRVAGRAPPTDVPDVAGIELPADAAAADEAVLHDYLRLGHDTSAAMSSFIRADPSFARIFPYYSGLRTLRTSPSESFFAFICSSNNNMKRISTMVAHLASVYGTPVATHAGRVYHAFPSVATLASRATESALREAGFGYRARYVPAAAMQLQRLADAEHLSAEALLLSWRALSRRDVATRLVQFAGVGRKVAGCIALLSLDQLGEIPVDTHVWQIAVRYMPDLEQKSLTDRVYDRVGDFFRGTFGEECAGLAHNILFVGELADFRELVPGQGKVTRATKKKAKTKPRGKVKGEVRKVEKHVVVSKEETEQAVVPKQKEELAVVAKKEEELAVVPKMEEAVECAEVPKSEDGLAVVTEKEEHDMVQKKEDVVVKSETIITSSNKAEWTDMSSFTNFSRKRKPMADRTLRRSRPRKVKKEERSSREYD